MGTVNGDMQVIARDGEPIEELLSRFKRGMVRSGILRDLKKHRFFVGPGEQRRLKAKEAARKMKRRQQKAADRRKRGGFGSRSR
ncbi:MAG TPA: 30S ribosomal protein S21 [Chloroflexota bacterium]|nr:30S ribosomal protein S21 [Chloroflexota bacterium]